MPRTLSTPLFLLCLSTIFFFFTISSAAPRISQAGKFCGTVRTDPTHYIPNFVKEMQTIAQLVEKQLWGTNSYGSKPTIYSLAQCMADLSRTDCLLCFAESRTKLPSCLPAISGRIYLDGCFLRYDNYSFYQEAVDDRNDRVVCNSSMTAPAGSRRNFTMRVNEAILNVTEKAVGNGGFGVAEVKGENFRVYGLGQCWRTINENGCRVCLEKARKEIMSNCVPDVEGRALNAGCYLRYSTQKFYSEGAENIGNEGSSSRGGIIAAIVTATFAFCMLSFFGACLGYKRFKRMKQKRENLGRLSSVVSKSNLNFKYETLEKATEFFDPSRKLGEGGAGSVFKGTLPDGRIIAVKRLVFNTRQWVDEFFNEVNLISGIKHKNLVQLLGCSIEGPESLLVYEYVVNKSLDQVLFERSTGHFLNWEQRYNIVTGIAEGLAFLHEGSSTRIIHRDIKCSNVLLDENMTAKIADFGLARCFAPDKSHISTGIAGTLGYMAPEYLIRGQLTEKADVYSFGVLVLEIVCGRKNTVFMQDSSPILQTVWKHYKSNSLLESVDPSLRGEFPAEQASNVLQIGLLCTQASVSMRPTMSEVVKMLTNGDCPIPLPMQPPFLNASVMDPDVSSMSLVFRSSTSTGGPTDTSNKSTTMSSSTSTRSTTVELSQPR